MSENLPPQTMPTEQPRQQPPSFAGSSKQYQDTVNTIPNLPLDQHGPLFGSISDALVIEEERAKGFAPVRAEDRRTIAEARAARNQIAAAFLSLAVTKAYQRRSHDKSVLSIPVEDLTGMGNLLLYHAIDVYARLPEQQAFMPYAEATIRHGLWKELWCNWLGVKVDSSQLSEIIAYRRKKTELLKECGRGISAAEMAEIMGIPIAKARHLECFARDRILLDELINPGGLSYLDQMVYREYAETHEPEPMPLAISREKKSVLIERALATIHHSQTDLLRQHYGLDGEAPLDTLSLAKLLGVREVSVKEKLKVATDTLREILPQIEAQTFDYAEWQKPRVNSPKTALTFLSAAGIPIPEEYRLPELRALARDQLRGISYDSYKHRLDRDRAIIIDYYGLDDEGRKYTVKELLQKHGIGMGVLYNTERKIIARFEALRATDEGVDVTQREST